VCQGVPVVARRSRPGSEARDGAEPVQGVGSRSVQRGRVAAPGDHFLQSLHRCPGRVGTRAAARGEHHGQRQPDHRRAGAQQLHARRHHGACLGANGQCGQCGPEIPGGVARCRSDDLRARGRQSPLARDDPRSHGGGRGRQLAIHRHHRLPRRGQCGRRRESHGHAVAQVLRVLPHEIFHGGGPGMQQLDRKQRQLPADALLARRLTKDSGSGMPRSPISHRSPKARTIGSAWARRSTCPTISARRAITPGSSPR